MKIKRSSSYVLASRWSACIFGLMLVYFFLGHVLATGAEEHAGTGQAQLSGACDTPSNHHVNSQASTIIRNPSSQPDHPPSQHPNHSQMLRQFIGGVIDYAQWPDKPSAITLCIAGSPVLLQSLHNTPLSSLHNAVAVKAILPTDSSNASQDCSVLFMGQAIAQNTAANWVMALVSKPVITIRENPETCSDGTLFCLYTSGDSSNPSSPTFDVNLDAISRSGVLLNPQVLTLSNTLMPNSPPP